MDSVDLIASKAGDLPTLPEVAAKVMEMVRDPDTRLKDLVDVIAKDPSLAGRVLRISNSAMFGLRGRVTTVGRAITILGFNTLRSIVLATFTQSLYDNKTSRFKDKILWEHALATGIAARTISQQVGFPSVEEAFVGGLLHDIGKVVMDANLGDRYQEVIQQVYNAGETFVEAERSIFEFDHAQVGSLVVRKWSLAAQLEEAVQLHHDPASATRDPKLCAIISLSNSLCARYEIGPEKLPDLDLAALDSTAIAGVDPDSLEEIAERVQEMLATEKEAFNL